MLWMLSCNIMTRLGVGRCDRIVWDTEENMTKWWKNPKGVEILAIIRLQVSSYFVWYWRMCILLMYMHSCVKATWLKFQLFTHTHTHSPSTYFLLYVLCCSVSHYSPRHILFVSVKVEFQENSPKEKQWKCVKLYSAVNNMNLCFGTTTFYDRIKGPAIQDGPVVDMILYVKLTYWKIIFFSFSAKAT